MSKERAGLLLWLAGVNLFISAFTFGGGYVVVPMIRKYFVERRNLFTEEELMEMAAGAQSAPGAIAVNLSALAGYRAAGRCGLAVSAAAAVTPPVVILTLISFYYSAFIANAAAAAALRGMQAAAAALIAAFVIDHSRWVIRERSPLLTLMMPAVFIAGFFLKIGAGTILAACALTALLRIARRAGRAAA